MASSERLGFEDGRFSESGANAPRSVDLAEYLQSAILSGRLPQGESLPSERDLMADFAVSRATVREALRILGARGLIKVKRGRKGGSYVCGPSGAAVSRSLDLFIQGHSIRFVDLLAVREAIEPVAAAQAAIYRNEDDIQELLRLSIVCEETFRSIKDFSVANIDWHMAIVRASHNSLFEAFMSSISSALFSATNRREFGEDIRKLVVGAHWRIFEAIREGDADAARRRMMRHVSAYGERLSLDDET